MKRGVFQGTAKLEVLTVRFIMNQNAFRESSLEKLQSS